MGEGDKADLPEWQRQYREKCEPALADAIDVIRTLPFEVLVNPESPGDSVYAWVAREMGYHEKRYLAVVDRYYLLLYLCGRVDLLAHGEKGNKWLFERCREVEAEPDGFLDLWSREHYKSSIITFAGVIQEILRDPEITIGIFSFNRPTAKAFLTQIMRELGGNPELLALFPDILWDNLNRAPRWSLDGGIVVRRQTNPKESTVEAWGLVDGQPTGRHFKLRIYDDVVTRESVTSPEQVQKVTEARELSDNLGSRGGREWNIGTRYSFMDTYATLLHREVLKPRIYAATDDGTMNGVPVFFSEQEWEDKKRRQPSQVAAQLLQNPLAGEEAMFRVEWLRSYEVRPATLQVYILVDPSKGSPSRRSDRTAMAVIGVDAAENRYLLDGHRHRMQLAERWHRLKDLYSKWASAPGVTHVAVGYERYGLQSDMEYFQLEMERTGIMFPIQEVAWTRDHAQSKADRVERLVPDIRDGRFFLPDRMKDGGKTFLWSVDEEQGKIVKREAKGYSRQAQQIAEAAQAYRLAKPLRKLDEHRFAYDLTANFIEELLLFPFGTHDDLVDAASRLYDMEPRAPMVIDHAAVEPPVFVDT